MQSRAVLLAAAALALAVSAAAAPREAHVAGRAVVVDGRSIFPVMAWAPCAGDVEELLAMGVNVLMGDACGDPAALARAASGRAWLVLDYERDAGSTLPGVIGYHQPDEPDANGRPPQTLPGRQRAVAEKRLVFLTLTAHFAAEQDPLSPSLGKDAYADYVARADVVGFDLYPLAHYCGHPKIGLASVYDEQRDLVRLADGKPTFQWIETNDLEHWCGPAPVGPAELQAEAWLAVAGGAVGIGWFTHGWPDGLWRRVHVAPDVAVAAARVSADLQRLSPVLLADEVEARMAAGSPVRAGARRFRGRVWIVAVNSSRETVRAAVGAAGVRPGRARVWRERRTVAVRRGGLVDTFAPLAVHVYELVPGGESAAPRPRRPGR